MKTITRSNKPRRLGEILIDEGVITKDQLNIALTEQKKVDLPLGKLLSTSETWCRIPRRST